MVKEENIIAWARYNNLEFLQCACRFTEMISHEENKSVSKRLEMKELIKGFRKINPNIDMNIFRSVHNVNLATVIGYRKNDGDYIHSFLESYDDEGRE